MIRLRLRGPQGYWGGGGGGGSIEGEKKLIPYFLRGRVKVSYDKSRFLSVDLLFEIFCQQNSNLYGAKCPQKMLF